MAHECLEERGLTDKRPIIADSDFFTGLVPLPRFRRLGCGLASAKAAHPRYKLLLGL